MTRQTPRSRAFTSMFALCSIAALGTVLVLAVLRPAPAAAEGTCPNEQLRAENRSLTLPDCRAYELVTPAFKAGAIPGVQDNFENETLHFTSLGGFGEAAGNPTAGGTVYAAARSGVGWSSTPLSPPAAEFQNAGIIQELYADQSQGSSLFFDMVPVGAKPIDGRIYVREADGSLTEVGPLTPPAAVAGWVPGDPDPATYYVGASPLFTHIFVSEGNNDPYIDYLWPGDTTVANQSLYEYDAASGDTTPSLVGVSGSGELISQCGTYLGGREPGRAIPGDTYNAISEDGSRVFFTTLKGGCKGEGRLAGITGSGPKVGEVYARIGGARTVAISEPSSADCAACDTSEAAQSAASEGAFFQGASRDGSKVFFLTEQPLLAGAKGQSLYEYDFEAPEGDRVSLVAPEVSGVVRVSEAANRVYFVSTAKLAGNLDAKSVPATAGDENLYVTEPGGATTFVTTLATPESEAKNEEAEEACREAGGEVQACLRNVRREYNVSRLDANDWNIAGSRPIEATSDGRFLLFQSTNDLTPGASGNLSQIYRYDAQTGGLVRLTIGEDGYDDNGNTPTPYSETGITPLTEPLFPATHYAGTSPAYEANALGAMAVEGPEEGASVFFDSSQELTPQSLKDPCSGETCLTNVFEWEQPGAGSCPVSSSEGCVFLISDGRDRSELSGRGVTGLLGVSPTARDVFFESGDPLVPQDTDTQADEYDARVDGGFPVPAEPKRCEPEACSVASAPVFGAPGSATFSGEGNLTAPVPVVKVKTKPLTRAEKLSKALKVCKKEKKKAKRQACEATARKRYGPPHKAKTKGGKR